MAGAVAKSLPAGAGGALTWIDYCVPRHTSAVIGRAIWSSPLPLPGRGAYSLLRRAAGARLLRHYSDW